MPFCLCLLLPRVFVTNDHLRVTFSLYLHLILPFVSSVNSILLMIYVCIEINGCIRSMWPIWKVWNKYGWMMIMMFISIDKVLFIWSVQYVLHQVILIYNVDDELESRCAFISNEYSVKAFKCQLVPVQYYNWSFLLVPILVIWFWVFSLICNTDWQPILNNKTSISP